MYCMSKRSWSVGWSLAMCLVMAGCAASDSGPVTSGGKNVILLRYNPGSESTEQREQGFLETLSKEFPDIKVISSDQYSGTTPESSLDKSQQLLGEFRGEVNGVFAVCEPNATGMLEALEQAGLAGQVKFVGFDPTPRLIDALAAGSMQGIVLQDPVQMGYRAVKAMVAHLEGQPVEKRIATGEYLATAQNMREPRMAELLKPEQFSEPATPKETKYVIAVIPKGTTHEFWKSVHAGAENAARELGNVEIQWKGPLLENDLDGQITVVQDFVTKQVDGICLAPLSSQGLIDAVRQAKQAGIPTVIFDSALDDESLVVSYVATDNYQGGAMAARRLAEVLQSRSRNLPVDTPSESTGY
jgi:ABC-type sugar transport system substrate-binding protein